jgi:chromosome segregation ATPase
MKKNMLVFDTTNLTAPDSDGRPAVRVEEVEVVPSGDGVTDSVIVKLTGANTEANNRITELEARLKVAEAERDAMRDAINRTKSNVLAAIIRGALEKAEKAKAELTEVRGVCVEIGEDREREYQKCKAAEAQLAEAQERIKTLEAANASWKHYHDAGSAAYERATAAEARAEAAESLLEGVKESNQIWKKQYREAEAEVGRLRELVEELRESLEYALRSTGCDGDLCTEDWHEDARRTLANLAALSPAEGGKGVEG